MTLEQVYAIRFSSGAVKVGRTKDFGRRLAEHTKQAAPHGVTVVDSWSAIVDDSYTAEASLMHIARNLDGVSRSVIGKGTRLFGSHAPLQYPALDQR